MRSRITGQTFHPRTCGRLCRSGRTPGLGEDNHCRSHCRLVTFRGLMWRAKYSAVIGRRLSFLYVPSMHFRAMVFSSQSHRRISHRTSNHGISPNDGASDSGYPSQPPNGSLVTCELSRLTVSPQLPMDFRSTPNLETSKPTCPGSIYVTIDLLRFILDPENSAQPSTRTINPKPWTPEPWTLIPEP